MERHIEMELFGHQSLISIEENDCNYNTFCKAILLYAPDEVKQKMAVLDEDRLMDYLVDKLIEIQDKIQGQQGIDKLRHKGLV